jgi:recombinational DNA repair protein (RecF pathway)
LLKLLAALGYRPSVDRCLECQAALTDAGADGFFDPARGGVLCAEHGRGRGYLTLGSRSGKILRSLLAGDLDALSSVDRAAAKELTEMIRSFHRYYSIDQR